MQDDKYEIYTYVQKTNSMCKSTEIIELRGDRSLFVNKKLLHK